MIVIGELKTSRYSKYPNGPFSNSKKLGDRVSVGRHPSSVRLPLVSPPLHPPPQRTMRKHCLFLLQHNLGTKLMNNDPASYLGGYLLTSLSMRLLN